MGKLDSIAAILSILILRGCILKLVKRHRRTGKGKALSILILRGCILKPSPIASKVGVMPSFNPHFARMHLETTYTTVVYPLYLTFQSSFCEDASWNWNDNMDEATRQIFQSSFCEDASWNFKPTGKHIWIIPFQSSFCEDASWNL